MRPAQSDLPLFARRLKAAHACAGLTQVELGVGAGIDEFSASVRVNQYERGKHWLDFGTAKRLATVLRVPTAYFCADDDALASSALHYHAVKGKRRKKLIDCASRLSAAGQGDRLAGARVLAGAVEGVFTDLIGFRSRRDSLIGNVVDVR